MYIFIDILLIFKTYLFRQKYTEHKERICKNWC